MMLRVAIGGALVVVAVVIAIFIERRRKAASPIRDAYPVPRQLFRADFPHPEVPWLVALFSSQTCDSCVSMRANVQALESPLVAVCDIEFPTARELHERYGISAVPMVLMTDADGVVHESFIGATTLPELQRALAQELEKEPPSATR